MTQPRTVNPSREQRSVAVDRAYDDATRSFDVAFASETPVMRWYGREILSCDKAHVDLSRFDGGLALLLDHSPESLVGVADIPRVDADRVCRARCTLSRNRDDIANDIRDAIRRWVSVGYETTSIVEDKTDADGVRTITWAWKPYEISLVSVPADAAVGVGRAAERESQQEKNMSEVKVEVPAPAAKVEVRDNSEAVRKEAAEIVKLAREHKCEALADKALASGLSLEQFRAELLAEIGKRSTPTQAEIGLSNKERQQYSFLRAIRSMLPHDSVDAGFELECSRAVAKKLKRDPRGLFVPWDVQSAKRDFTVAGTASAAVATNLLGGSFIEALRNAMVLQKLGVTMLMGLDGDIAIPKQSGTSTAYWTSEGVAPTESQLTLSQVTGTPHQVGANMDYTRKTLLQSSIDVEALVRSDLAEVLARGIDYACFNDAGAGAPAYLLGVSGVNNPSINLAGAATYAEILAFASSIAADNVATDGAAWVTTNEVFYNLCGLPRHATASAAGFIADVDNSTIIGRPAIQSESLPANTAVLGVWRHLLVGMWGNGLDIMVDPYTQSKAGIVQVTAFTDVDFLPRHPQAFAYNSAVTS